jgi:hypothetical protein
VTRLVWLGVLGAPFAWAVQHIVGWALSEARCDEAHTGIAFDPVVAVVAGAAALVAVAGGVASLLAFRATREAESEPPQARVKFLAVIGMTLTPLFFALILMNGFGAVLLPVCRQG